MRDDDMADYVRGIIRRALQGTIGDPLLSEERKKDAREVVRGLALEMARNLGIIPEDRLFVSDLIALFSMETRSGEEDPVALLAKLSEDTLVRLSSMPEHGAKTLIGLELMRRAGSIRNWSFRWEPDGKSAIVNAECSMPIEFIKVDLVVDLNPATDRGTVPPLSETKGTD
jgi:hypothetical protein